MAQHLWVNAAHNRGPRCAVLQELEPLGGDTYAGRSALKRRRLQGPPAVKQEELAHEPGSPAHAACPSVGVELRGNDDSDEVEDADSDEVVPTIRSRRGRSVKAPRQWPGDLETSAAEASAVPTKEDGEENELCGSPKRQRTGGAAAPRTLVGVRLEGCSWPFEQGHVQTAYVVPARAPPSRPSAIQVRYRGWLPPHHLKWMDEADGTLVWR